MHLLIQGCLDVIYDFLCVLIPIPVVLKLQLALRQRIMVAALFAAGFLACIAGIVRTYYMYKVTSRGERDVTWDAFPVWLATAVELYVGIVGSLFYDRDGLLMLLIGLRLHSPNSALLRALPPQTPLRHVDTAKWSKHRRAKRQHTHLEQQRRESECGGVEFKRASWE